MIDVSGLYYSFLLILLTSGVNKFSTNDLFLIIIWVRCCVISNFNHSIVYSIGKWKLHLICHNVNIDVNTLVICRGLMCIHRMKIVHRDLKSANCLVNKHWTVKICDFGLSRIMLDPPIRDSLSAGTPEWMAPELIWNEPFDEKCDIFSFGVMMWELSTLNRPWEGVPPERGYIQLTVNSVSRIFYFYFALKL
jgi:serine/threonine protein kinase